MALNSELPHYYWAYLKAIFRNGAYSFPTIPLPYVDVNFNFTRILDLDYTLY